MTLNTINKIRTYTNITDVIIDFLCSNDLKCMYIFNSDIPDIIHFNHSMIFREAKKEFSKIGRKKFYNNNKLIIVTNEDIKESIAKTLRNGYQKYYVSLHVKLFRYLDVIIEKAVLISEAVESKNREKYKYWNYYVVLLSFNNKLLLIEFDTVLRNDGENHFRLQRIYEYEKLLKLKKQALDRSSS